MAIKTASTAEVRFDGSAIAKIRDITLNISRELLDETGIGDKDKTFTYGTRNTSGSGTLLYDSADSATKSLMNTILSDSSELSTLTIVLDDSSTVGTIEGSVALSQVGITVSTGQLVSVPISFQISGKLTGSF